MTTKLLIPVGAAAVAPCGDIRTLTAHDVCRTDGAVRHGREVGTHADPHPVAIAGREPGDA